ncbi:MAG TPA: SusC/RagA family TonB-linked outer membrane protein, partial [Chitinophaga sp.]
LQGLALTGYAGYDPHYWSEKQFNNTWNEYVYNPSTQQYDVSPLGLDRTLNVTKGSTEVTTLHAELDYKRSFGKNNIDAFAAYEQSQDNYDYISAYRAGFVSGALPELFAGPQNVNTTNNEGTSYGGRINYFGRINYDYANKYLASFTLRDDGSLNFAPGKRYGIFPSISAGWVMSEEPFMKDHLSFVNHLKLRASWGQMGNDNVGAYQYLATYQFSGSNGQNGYTFGNNLTSVQGLVENAAPNPNITWERAATTNLGLEAILFKERLSFSLDLFRSERTNILAARNLSVPDYTGLSLPQENIGRVLNRGLEAQLSYHGTLSQDFSYNVAGNLSFARNKVQFLDEAPGIPDYQKREGYPIDAYVVYEADGLFQTKDQVSAYPHINQTMPGDVKLIDVNGDNVIDSKDQVRKYYGTTPEIVYGFNLDATYKRFSLSVFFQGQANAYLSIRPNLNFDQAFFYGRWQQEGDNRFPRIFMDKNSAAGESSYNSTFWLRNAGFLRLKNVYLSYDLPRDWMNTCHMSAGKFFLTAANLFTIDQIKYFDPETNSSNGVGNFPILRTIQVGLNLGF